MSFDRRVVIPRLKSKRSDIPTPRVASFDSNIDLASAAPRCELALRELCFRQQRRQQRQQIETNLCDV